MAGDWIKVEHATTDKSEVLRIAELLGISRREAVGLLVDFWVWLDRNMRHADSVTSVTHMSRKSIDEVTRCAGFAACLVDVGWAEIDDTTGILTIVNGERHNGNPAKTRALGKDRKAASRSRECHDESVTREEKRRVSTSLRSVDKARASTLPTDFTISDRVRKWAHTKGFRPDDYLETFVGRNKASGKKYLDWDQTFMNAIREDWYGIRAGPPRASVADARAKTNEGIYGPLREMGHGRRDDEAIDGEAVRVA